MPLSKGESGPRDREMGGGCSHVPWSQSPHSSEAPRADTWMGHFWPPELWDDKLLLHKLPSWWYFVTAALANQCRDGQVLTLHWPQRAREASLDDFRGVFGFLPHPPSDFPAARFSQKDKDGAS